MSGLCVLGAEEATRERVEATLRRMGETGSAEGSSVPPAPGGEDFGIWFFALYGNEMLAIQLLERAVSLLYLVVTTDPNRKSNASTQRQWRSAFQRIWKAYQRGSAGVRLNDAHAGIKDHLSVGLYEDLDSFIKGPRNQLAHNYLVERTAGASEGMTGLAAASGELIDVYTRAMRLRDAVHSRAMEIIGTWPESPEAPDDVKRFIEDIRRIATLKQFPRAALAHAQKAKEQRAADRAGA